jgi:hypothetical protein
MDDQARDMIENWPSDDAENLASGRANDAFLARVRQERAQRRRPVIAVIGAGVAIAACAIAAFVLFPTAPKATAPAQSSVMVESEPAPPAQDWIEPSEATLATLMRLNARGDIDTLVLSRADCVAWTRNSSPLGP